MRNRNYLRRPGILDKVRQVVRLAGIRVSMALERKTSAMPRRRLKRYCLVGFLGFSLCYGFVIFRNIAGDPRIEVQAISVPIPAVSRDSSGMGKVQKDRSAVGKVNRDSAGEFTGKLDLGH